MNTNLFHNILNVLMLVVGLASLLGCVDMGAAGWDCSNSWLGPQLGAYLTMGLAGIKILINILRDGLGGLVKPQPPVVK